MGEVSDTMREKLADALSPTRLEIIDNSSLHEGHMGARAGGESHFAMTIECAAFSGLGRVQRQRLVHAVLARELEGPVHALSLRAIAPGEV